MITISHIDHIVLTVKHMPATVEFYVRVLGISAASFGNKRTALTFGSQKINLHEAGNEFEPKALEGPVERTGATGKLLSFYICDPDQNLIEIANRI